MGLLQPTRTTFQAPTAVAEALPSRWALDCGTQGPESPRVQEGPGLCSGLSTVITFAEPFFILVALERNKARPLPGPSAACAPLLGSKKDDRARVSLLNTSDLSQA